MYQTWIHGTVISAWAYCSWTFKAVQMYCDCATEGKLRVVVVYQFPYLLHNKLCMNKRKIQYI